MDSRLHWLGIAGALLASAAVAAADAGCAPQGDITPDCRFERPEDLEAVAGGRALIVSEYRGLAGEQPGALSLYRGPGVPRRVLYPAADAAPTGVGDWGDANCPGAPGAALAPHGIHHSPTGGSNRLLVVNHGTRESIELFEIRDADDPERLSLRWRGCVVAPASAWLNDVVGLPDGGFAASHMVARGTAEHDLFSAETERSATGVVYAWFAERGWFALPGSEGSLPNGLEISPDGSVLFINEYFGDRVSALDWQSGRRLWSATVDAPDNSSFNSHGLLLVTGHGAGLEAVFACNEHPLKPCALPYHVIGLDPTTGYATPLYRGGENDPGGAATVAVEFDGDLVLGSFVGDRLLRVDGAAAGSAQP